MSNKPIIRLLLIAILILAGAHVYVSLRGVGNALVQRATLLDVSMQEAGRLSVERRGENRTVLEREDGWRITSPYAARAEERVVRRLLDELTLGSIRSSYTESDLLQFGRTRGDYGLDDPSVRVTVGDGADAPSVSFGMRTPTGDGVFAAVSGDARVYVVGTNVLDSVDLPSAAFRLKELFPGGLRSVEAFDLKRGTGSFMRFRLRDGLWSRFGSGGDESSEPASIVKVRTLLAGLGRATIADYVWPVGAPGESSVASAPLLAGYGLDPESAVTVTLRSPGQADRQVSFGKEATDGRVYALVQNAGAVVTVDGALKDFAMTADFSDTRLFPYEPSNVTRISVTSDGVNYLLARREDGTWLLDSPVAASADAEAAEALVSRILSLTAADRADNGIVVSLSTNAPSETVSASSVIGALALADLRSREMLKIAPADVRRIAVTDASAAKPTSVAYDRDLRTWTLESSDRAGSVDADAVQTLLSALNPLLADKVVKLKVTPEDLHLYELESPRWTVAVDTARAGVLRRNILIGGSAQGGRFATLGSSDAVFVLPDKTVSALTAPLVKEQKSNEIR